MRWKQLRRLPPQKFRRLVGVEPAVFAQVPEAALASEPVSSHPVKGARRGPKPKLGIEGRLLVLLMYYREYRTFAHVGASFGISEAQCWRIVTDLEARLLQDARFHLARKQSLRSDTHWQGVVIDVGECAVEQPKKAAGLLLGQKAMPHAESPSAFGAGQPAHPGRAPRQGPPT